MPANLALTDAETAALVAELKRIVAADPFPPSPRIRKLRRLSHAAIWAPV